MYAERRVLTAIMGMLATSAVTFEATGAEPKPKPPPPEWGPLSGVVVSTITSGGKEVLNTPALAVARAAIRQGLKLIVADRGAAAQIIQDLKTSGVITDSTAHLVSVTSAPLHSGWARDTGPIFRFSPDGKKVEVVGTESYLAGWKRDLANKAYDAVAKALGGIPSPDIPTFWDLPPEPGNQHPRTGIPSDGGNWLPSVLNNKSVLITSSVNDLGAPESVADKIKSEFRYDEVLFVDPMPRDPAGYVPLSNDHLDLYIRTLPDGRALVADVSAGDPLKPALDSVAATLTNKGYNVTRLQNAPTTVVEGGTTKKVFTSYTNSMFLGKTILIPLWGDAQMDQAAKTAYETALPGYTVEQVDMRGGGTSSGAVRCSAREIPLLPSEPAGMESSSRNNPRVSYDPVTGALNFTPGVINYLGEAAGTSTEPLFAADPFFGSTIELTGLTYQPGMSSGEQYVFAGGTLTISNGQLLLRADVPTFTINGTWPDDALTMSGILGGLQGPDSPSPWFDAFQAELVSGGLLADVFALSDVDFIALSSGFTMGFADVHLASLGLVGNGTPDSIIPEPGMAIMAICVVLFATHHRLRRNPNARTERR